jgi:thiamine phosphate synthase YjbQ (UPF0047 family)
MAFRQEQHTLEIGTPGRGLYMFTDKVSGWLEGKRVGDGLLTLFIQHGSSRSW